MRRRLQCNGDCLITVFVKVVSVKSLFCGSSGGDGVEADDKCHDAVGSGGREGCVHF